MKYNIGDRVRLVKPFRCHGDNDGAESLTELGPDCGHTA